MILIRYFLICIIGYLIVRSFVRFGKEDQPSADIRQQGGKDKVPSKKVSKKIGEYIDYEEIKKDKSV
jgi:hypothetical protein